MHHTARERHEHIADVLLVLRACDHLGTGCAPRPARVKAQREQRNLESALLRRARDAGLGKHGDLDEASPAPSAVLDVEAEVLAAPDLRVHLSSLARQPHGTHARLQRRSAQRREGRVLWVVHRGDVGLLDEDIR